MSSDLEPAVEEVGGGGVGTLGERAYVRLREEIIRGDLAPGALVSEISITDLAAIYEVRARLESWAARLAADRASREDRGEAERLVEELRSQLDGGDYEALLATDRRIHRFVYRCSKNAFLAETLDHYHNLSLRILHVAVKRYPALTPRLDEVVHEQRAVLEAICRGDGDTAERIATAHIRGFEQHIRTVI